MIIEFSTKNFRSFRDLATISFEAEPLKSGSVQVISTEAGNLLPAVGVFGANASGKSNLIKALFFMWWSVQNSNFLAQPTTKHPMLKPFLLNSKTAKEPSYFQIILWDKEREAEYRYGFEISSQEVVSEWLELTTRVKKNRRSVMIFRREGQSFTIHKSASKELTPLRERVLPTTLAITVFAQFAYDLAYRVATLMSNESLTIIDGSQSTPIDAALKRCEEDSDYRNRVLALMQKADFGILQLVVKQSKVSKEELGALPPQIRSLIDENAGGLVGVQVNTLHKIYDRPNETAVFNMNDHESRGTARFFELSALVLPVLESGGVLVIDELGSSLHPFITKAAVGLFQNRKTNPKGAQLLFCSHEMYLLSSRANFRRDQVWFTEKNNQEETTLRSLAEYKTRNDFEIAKNYLAGRFGAVPTVGFDED